MEDIENPSSDLPDTWHPKLTPFRFLILFSTIGLGIAKAYAVSQDLSLFATTVEWVAGVVLFSLIFILSLFEPSPPLFLTPFFKSDIVQTVSKVLSLDHPQYRTDEAPTSEFPPITAYRLLTSVSVTAFGVAKAYLVSQNLSQAANAIDWILGILMTSCIYVLGLYENNSVNLMPYLFYTNYSWLVDTVLLVIKHLIGMYLSFLWIRKTFKVTFTLLLHLSAISSVGLYNLSTSFIKTSFFLLFSRDVIWNFFDQFRAIVHIITGFSAFHRPINTFQQVFLSFSSFIRIHFRLDRGLSRLRDILHSETSRSTYESVRFVFLCAVIPATCAAFCIFFVVGISKIVLLFERHWIMLFWNLLMSPVYVWLANIILLIFLGFTLSLCWFNTMLIYACFALPLYVLQQCGRLIRRLCRLVL